MGATTDKPDERHALDHVLNEVRRHERVKRKRGRLTIEDRALYWRVRQLAARR